MFNRLWIITQSINIPPRAELLAPPGGGGGGGAPAPGTGGGGGGGASDGAGGGGGGGGGHADAAPAAAAPAPPPGPANTNTVCNNKGFMLEATSPFKRYIFFIIKTNGPVNTQQKSEIHIPIKLFD